MEHEMISVKRELSIKSEDDGSSDGEPKLEIADQANDEPPNNQDAVESLLLLGRQAVVTGTHCQANPEIQRQRAASVSLSEPAAHSLPLITLSRRHSMDPTSKLIPNLSGHSDKGAVVSYYQRMRERNNEASKRCRLKRRMKAVSMENQASMLSMANKMLKQRIQRLEHVGAALKEGVKKIQAGQCGCDSTLGIVRQASRDYFDPEPGSGKDLPTCEVISKSRLIREQELAHPSGIGSSGMSKNSCSSEEDFAPTSPIRSTFAPSYVKTALDVINETIVKSLDTPLNLVKNSPQNCTSSGENSPIFRQSLDSIGSSGGAPDSQNHSMISVVKIEHPEVDSTSNLVCIANQNGASLCRGEMLNLNKLTCYLDLISRKVVKDDGASAMERAIIKSRLKIPFWSADETALFICGSHRASIVHATDLNCCSLCNKRRSYKKGRMMPQQMYTITYRMSLEYYTRSGHVLPIGLAVCSLCRDKHLKSVDLSKSREIPANSPDMTEISIMPSVKREASSPLTCYDESFSPKMRQLSTTSSSSNVSSTNGEVQIIMTPVQNHVISDPNLKTVVPVSSSNSAVTSLDKNYGTNTSNIFAKIGHLNEAIQAINPRYQPIGFSITSMDSCSPSVLKDAVSAAETGVYTLLSVIAPGQESQLWENIRPMLDKRLNRSH